MKITVFSGGVLGLRVMLGDGDTGGEIPGDREGLLVSGEGASKTSGLGVSESRS